MKRHLFASVTSLMLLLVSTLAAEQAMSPHVIRLRLAGATLNPRQSEFHEYDSQQKYHLVAGNNFNGDGAGSAYLLLCPNPKKQPDASALRVDAAGLEMEQSALPQLRTGAGINIGDTPRQVQHKMGAVPKGITYYPKTQMRVYHYEARLTLDSAVPGAHQKVRYIYRADYAFSKGRLWSILYMIQD